MAAVNDKNNRVNEHFAPRAAAPSWMETVQPEAFDALAAAELPADYEHVVPVAGWRAQSDQHVYLHGRHAMQLAEGRRGLLPVPWGPSAMRIQLADVQFHGDLVLAEGQFHGLSLHG